MKLNETKDSNIVSLFAVRNLKKVKTQDEPYARLIEKMDKLELLEEMVRFQQKRSEKGALDLQMMIRGRILFQALEKEAETHELKVLSKSYVKHLELELKTYLETGNLQQDSDDLDPMV